MNIGNVPFNQLKIGDKVISCSGKPGHIAGLYPVGSKDPLGNNYDDWGGAGLFGVEFFIKGSEVIFSELSPRPHDTGMVTLLTQNQSEFDLHLKAIMGLPISKYDLEYREGASAVVLSESENGTPEFTGIEDALNVYGTTVRIFGKPVCRKNRRMAVVLNTDLSEAKRAASKIKVTGSE